LKDIVLKLVVAGHEISPKVGQDVNDLIAANLFIHIGEYEKVVVQACRDAVEMRSDPLFKHTVSRLEDWLNA
jgi:hypothetical protein